MATDAGAVTERQSGEAGELAIAAIRTTPVNVELDAPYRWSVGYFPGFTKTVVEVETASGLVGLGEAPSHWAARTIDEAIAPRLIGADARDLADCERRALPPLAVMRNTEDESMLRAYGGVEMALWDLAGKLAGRSVADLLGGRVRDAVPFTEYFAPRLGAEQTPVEIARYCARMAEQHGAVAFEGKVGFGDLRFQLEIVREVRAAVGAAATIRLDANAGWSVTTARHALRELARYDVRSVEDPVRSVAELRRLRGISPIAFSSHDTDLVAAAAWGVPDAIVVNLTALGGIRRTVAFANACEALGVDLWFYSPDTGIANAAYVQVAAAVEWIAEPSQTLLRWHTDDVVAGGPPRPRDGVLPVRDLPGLGVELDRAALARCHRRFLEQGPLDAYAHPSRPGRYGARIVAVGGDGR